VETIWLPWIFCSQLFSCRTVLHIAKILGDYESFIWGLYFFHVGSLLLYTLQGNPKLKIVDVCNLNGLISCV
jgi:hypothetical protein